MQEDAQKTWIEEIQAEAQRLTLKRLQEDKDERNRLLAEENKAQIQADSKKKA
jgi:hypothetical protein